MRAKRWRAAAPAIAIAGIVALAAVAIGAYMLLRPAPVADQAPQFQVLVIKPGNFFAEEAAEAAEAGGKVPPQAIDFTAEAMMLPVTTVQRSAEGKAFLDLLRAQPGEAAILDNATVFRVRDGERITADGGDALEGDNTSVLVVPHDIIMLFDDEHSAFVQIRMRVSGLQ
jgi:hypothetical protein